MRSKEKKTESNEDATAGVCILALQTWEGKGSVKQNIPGPGNEIPISIDRGKNGEYFSGIP